MCQCRARLGRGLKWIFYREITENTRKAIALNSPRFYWMISHIIRISDELKSSICFTRVKYACFWFFSLSISISSENRFIIHNNICFLLILRSLCSIHPLSISYYVIIEKHFFHPLISERKGSVLYMHSYVSLDTVFIISIDERNIWNDNFRCRRFCCCCCWFHSSAILLCRLINSTNLAFFIYYCVCE